ncbi:hypothetical protein D3C72_2422100 [compost metagenome]
MLAVKQEALRDRTAGPAAERNCVPGGSFEFDPRGANWLLIRRALPFRPEL